MHRTWIIVPLLLFAASFATPVAFASTHFRGTVTFSVSSTHFHSPASRAQATAQGVTLTAAGTLAGLGNRDVTVNLRASGTGTATCTNAGGNQAPGRNPISVNVTGVQSLPVTLIANGQTPFRVTTAAPTLPSAKQAGCPNDNWKVTAVKATFTQATITVQQGGTTVLEQRFTL